MTPQIRQRPRPRLVRTLVAVFVGVASLLPVVVGPSASASPIDDKRAQAQQIANKLDSLGNRISELDEQYNDARIRVQQLTGKVAAAKQRADETAAKYSTAKNKARDQAIAAYMDGGSAARAARVVGGSGKDVLLRNEYLSAAASDDQTAIDALKSAREDLDAQQAALSKEQAAAKSAADRVASARKATAAAANQQQALLRQVQGQLSQLVAAEQARLARAAAAAARARIEAAPSRARQQAAAAASGRSGSTGGGNRASRSRTTPDNSLTAPPGTDAPAPSSGAGAAVAFAKSQVGKPYNWGGDGPDSYDCSGLTMVSWQHGGVSLPHSSRAQYSATTHVPISAIQPGDLVFYGRPIHHVGIYVGGGQMVDAPHSGANVRYSGIYRSDLVGVGRPG